jgi:hypothetical protein
MHLRTALPLRSLTVQAHMQSYDNDAGAGGGAGRGSLLQTVVFKLGAMSSAVFLFFSTSSLVSFTLRETQVGVGEVYCVYGVCGVCACTMPVFDKPLIPALLRPPPINLPLSLAPTTTTTTHPHPPQARMLRFTYLLQHHIQNELSIFTLVCTHATESLMMVPGR